MSPYLFTGDVTASIPLYPYLFTGGYPSPNVPLSVLWWQRVTPCPLYVHLCLRVTSCPPIYALVAVGYPMPPYLYTGRCRSPHVPLSMHWWLRVTPCPPIFALVAAGHPMSPYLCTDSCVLPNVTLSMYWWLWVTPYLSKSKKVGSFLNWFYISYDTIPFKHN